MLLCSCHYKAFAKDPRTLNLKEYKRPSIQCHLPKLDKNKVIPSEFDGQQSVFRCPKCGKGIAPKRIIDTQAVMDAQALAQKEAQEQADHIKRMEGLR